MDSGFCTVILPCSQLAEHSAIHVVVRRSNFILERDITSDRVYRTDLLSYNVIIVFAIGTLCYVSSFFQNYEEH